MDIEREDTGVKRQELLDFVHRLVEQYALPDADRQRIDIHSCDRGGHGTRGYGRSEQGVELGWWVHPDRYRKELNWLLDVLRPEGNESILSVACGPAFHEVTLARHFPGLHITATDFDPKEITTAKQIARSLGAENVGYGLVQEVCIAIPKS